MLFAQTYVPKFLNQCLSSKPISSSMSFKVCHCFNISWNVSCLIARSKTLSPNCYRLVFEQQFVSLVVSAQFYLRKSVNQRTSAWFCWQKLSAWVYRHQFVWVRLSLQRVLAKASFPKIVIWYVLTQICTQNSISPSFLANNCSLKFLRPSS